MFNFLKSKKAVSDPQPVEVETSSYSEEGFNVPDVVEFNNVEEDQEQVKDAFIDYDPRDEHWPNLLEKLSKRVLEVVLFLTPLLVLPITFEAVEFPKELLITFGVGLSVILWITGAVLREKVSLRLSKFFLFAIAFLVVQVLTVLFSLSQTYSIFGRIGSVSGSLIMTVNGLVLLFMVSSLYNRDEMRRLIKILVSSLGMALVLGVLRLFGINVFSILGVSQLVTTVGSANTLGIFAALLVLFSFSGSGFFNSSIWRSVAVFSGLLGLIYLIALDWWVLYAVLLVGLICRFILSGGAEARRFSNFVFPVALILIIVFAWLIPVPNELRAKLPAEVAPTHKASFDIAKGVLFDNPMGALFGVGQENFPVAFDKFKSQEINNSIFWNARFNKGTSEFLSLVTNTGILGALSILTLLGSFIWIFVRRNIGRGNVTLLSIFASFLAAFFLYPFSVSLWMGFWLVLGLLIVDSNIPLKEMSFSVSQKMMMSASAVCVGLILFVAIEFFFVIGIARADLLFKKGVQTSDLDQSLQFFTQAYNLNGKEDVYARTISQRLIAVLEREINRQDLKQEEKLQKIQNVLSTSINFSAQLTDVHSEDALNWFTRATVYQSAIGLVGGVDEFAIRFYLEAQKRSPIDPMVPTRLGLIYLNRSEQARRLGQSGASQQKENLELAEDQFLKAIALKRDLASALYNLGVVYEREGRLADSIKQLEQSAFLDNKNPGLFFELGLLYYRNNQKDDSIASLQQAIALFPNYSNARWFVALLHEERGEIDKALEQLDKVLELNPDNQIVIQKISSLNAGKREIPPKKVTEKQPLEESGQTR